MEIFWKMGLEQGFVQTKSGPRNPLPIRLIFDSQRCRSRK
jgi:hypothetical protein